MQISYFEAFRKKLVPRKFRIMQYFVFVLVCVCVSVCLSVGVSAPKVSLSIDKMDGRGLISTCCECLPKKAEVTWY